MGMWKGDNAWLTSKSINKLYEPKRSTSTNSTRFVSKSVNSMDKCVCIYTDLKAAFDKVCIKNWLFSAGCRKKNKTKQDNCFQWTSFQRKLFKHVCKNKSTTFRQLFGLFSMADEDMRASMFLRSILFFISSISVFTTQKKKKIQHSWTGSRTRLSKFSLKFAWNDRMEF